MLMHLSKYHGLNYRPKLLQLHCRIFCYLSIVRYVSRLSTNKKRIFCLATFRSFLCRETAEKRKIFAFSLCAMNW
uniref:Uncharacterized protein n=1 Tax=Arundo donax TaxID=35708 RepID=A0A0A9FBH7_ARUDO